MGGEEFVATLPAELGDAVRPLVFFDKEAFADTYFQLFDELYDAYDGDDTKILLAPSWAHGASEAFMRRVRAVADQRGGVMIHMHLLQSPVHKAGGGAATTSPRFSGSTISVSSPRTAPMAMRSTSPNRRSR